MTTRTRPAGRTVALLLAAVVAVVVGAVTLVGRQDQGSAAAGVTSSAGSGEGYVGGDGTRKELLPAQRAAPRELSGTTLDGKEFRLADHRGEVVVVNTWAHWCAPCREEAPALQRAWEKLRARDVQFVGVNTRDDAPPAQAFVDKFGLTYPSVSDPDGVLMLAFRDTVPPSALPSTLILDRQGRVAVRWLGKVSETTLRNLVEQVLAEGPA